MAALLDRMSSTYHTVMVDMRDPRMDAYPLMSSPFPTMALCLAYVAVVCWLGPWWMKHRPAYQVQRLVIAYNAFQVIFSTWLFFKILFAGWWSDYSYSCQPVDYSGSPRALQMVSACWWYYFSKFTEFPDTFFFIARKKFQHVSVLHVVHHGLMPFSVWWGAKFIPGGHSTFFGLANTFVHIFMYIYYLLAALGPSYKKYIWWKKHMTNLQMVQFVAISAHSFQLVFRSDCDYPSVAFWYIGAHGILFFILFSGFYKKEYHSSKAKKDDTAPMTNGSYSNGSAINGDGHAKTNGFSLTNGTSLKENGHRSTQRKTLLGGAIMS